MDNSEAGSGGGGGGRGTTRGSARGANRQVKLSELSHELSLLPQEGTSLPRHLLSSLLLLLEQFLLFLEGVAAEVVEHIHFATELVRERDLSVHVDELGRGLEIYIL